MNTLLRKIFIVAALAVGTFAHQSMVAMNNQSDESDPIITPHAVYEQLCAQHNLETQQSNADMAKLNDDLKNLVQLKDTYVKKNIALNAETERFNQKWQEHKNKQKALELDKKASRRSKGMCQCVREIQAEDKRLKELTRKYRTESTFLATQRTELDQEEQRINEETRRLKSVITQVTQKKEELSSKEAILHAAKIIVTFVDTEIIAKNDDATSLEKKID